MTARNAIDPDLWWHLRTGQWIVETGHVPSVDPFSFTRAGSPWVAHEWLSEVVFYELWKHGGTAALIVFSAIITTAGFMLLYLRCLSYPASRTGPVFFFSQRKRHWAAAATALGALASAPSWGARPQMFTFALASLLLCLLEWGEHRPQLLFAIPPLFLLWLNLHAGFALAPALLIAYGAGLLMETALGNASWPEARPIVLRVLLLLAACLLLVPLNPSGAHLYSYPFDTLRSHGMRSFIGEWRSPNFHQALYRPLLLIWMLLLIALATSRSRLRGRTLAPLLLTAFAALDAVRHIPIFVLLAMPVIVAALPLASESRTLIQSTLFKRRLSFRRLQPALHASVVILMAAFALVHWISLARHEDSKEAQLFPEQAAAFLRAGDYPRDLFVYYDWGGYAIWKLYPEYRVFVDGRADLYAGDAHGNDTHGRNINADDIHGPPPENSPRNDKNNDLLLQAVNTVLELRTGWQGVLDRWKIDALLVPPSTAIAQALLIDPGWQPVFNDSRAIVLLRRHPVVQNAGILPGTCLSQPETLNQKGAIN